MLGAGFPQLSARGSRLKGSRNRFSLHRYFKEENVCHATQFGHSCSSEVFSVGLSGLGCSHHSNSGTAPFH